MGVADMTRVWGCSPLLRQGSPLAHAEAVLLVGDHQAQVCIFQAPGDEGVGADGEVDLPVGQLLRDGPFRSGPGGAGQQGAPDAQGFHQWGQALIVLPGQDLRGSHQRRLPAVLHGEVHAGGGHHGLSGAYVPLDQAVHGYAGGHVGQGLLHAPPLGVRQGEGSAS